MPRFIYRVKKGPEENLEGAIEADSENAAVNKLIQSGYYPVWVTEKESFVRKSFISYGKSREDLYRVKIKTKETANFTRRLSELLGSGLALYNALGVIENQTENNNLKLIIGTVKSRIKDGKKFSEALENYPYIFSELCVNLVRSGEESGLVNEVLENISDFLDKDEDMRSKVIVALAYPGLMAIVGLATVFILVIFIVPRLVNIFIEMGEELPLVTRILLRISDFIKAYWILLILFMGGLIFLLKSGKLNPIAKNKIDRIKLRLPILGDLVRNVEFARFSRTLSMLLKNGVPILDSLKITSGVVTNNAIRRDISAIHNDVKLGLSLATAMKKRECFPLFLANMAAVGEEGGFLDKALFNIARNYEIESDKTMKTLTAFLEPAFILIMGLVVGFIVISMLLPVFQISLVTH
nr:type II secretion system F family protein [Candidatus Omnitrophota bacterium]